MSSFCPNKQVNYFTPLIARVCNWNCSNCNTYNESPRNTTPCQHCGLSDCERNRILSIAFHQFGIIPSPKISDLPNDTPFFIYPLLKPKITYYLKPLTNGITIRFIIELTNANHSTKYNVSEMRFVVRNTNNHKYSGLTKILTKADSLLPNTFDYILKNPYYGTYTLDIEALIRYKIGTLNGHKTYNTNSPKTALKMTLHRARFYHEKLLENFIVTQSQFESKKNENSNDEKYFEPQLLELQSDGDDYQFVSSQFLESARMEMSDIYKLYIYEIDNKHKRDSYNNKKKQMLRLLKMDKSKLNETPLYHGTNIDTIIKIMHQGFLRQFTSRSAYGKGSYFARDAVYSCSTNYAKKDESDFQHILLCNVVCGEWTDGDSGMKVPPSKPNNEYLYYETTVNNCANPSVFVTYQDDQALPTYLISFRRK